MCGLDFFKKAVAYQKQYNKNHMHVTNALQTNGFSLTQEWCAFLKENNFWVGLSVDGTKEIHDSLRHTKTGTDTFQRVLNNRNFFLKLRRILRSLQKLICSPAGELHSDKSQAA